MRYKWMSFKRDIEARSGTATEEYTPSEEIVNNVLRAVRVVCGLYKAKALDGDFAHTRFHRSTRIPHLPTILRYFYTLYDPEHEDFYLSRLPPLLTPPRMNETVDIIEQMVK
jgi:hypothetical protein